MTKCDFQGEKVQYTIPHKYTPDFITPDGKILIEAKGRFVDSAEASKYKWIREVLPEGVELVFLFYNYKTPMPGAKTRKKCGTKRTHGEWAETNGFRWYTKASIGEIL